MNKELIRLCLDIMAGPGEAHDEELVMLGYSRSSAGRATPEEIKKKAADLLYEHLEQQDRRLSELEDRTCRLDRHGRYEQ